MNSLLEDYSLVLTQDVIWGDMDAYGHINNTVYFRYFEDLRMAYFEKLRISEHKDKTNIGPILAYTHCDYKLPLNYPDKIQIAGRATVLSAKKIRMDYAVFSEKFNAIAAEGECLLVYYDYSVNKSCKIPQDILSALESLEGLNNG